MQELLHTCYLRPGQRTAPRLCCVLCEWRAVQCHTAGIQLGCWTTPAQTVEDSLQREPRPGTVCRWIERFNSKLREAAKKDEKRRLKDFVEAAYARDPRVLAHREAERAQRCGPACQLLRSARLLKQQCHCASFVGAWSLVVDLLTRHCAGMPLSGTGAGSKGKQGWAQEVSAPVGCLVSSKSRAGLLRRLQQQQLHTLQWLILSSSCACRDRRKQETVHAARAKLQAEEDKAAEGADKAAADWESSPL